MLADLDGVVYKGADAIPYAVESINAIASAIRVAYLDEQRVSNGCLGGRASHRAGVARRLRTTSSRRRKPQCDCSPGSCPRDRKCWSWVAKASRLRSRRAGSSVTRSAEDSPAAVIQGFAPEVGWKDLAEAAFALHGGIPWVATNTDWTLPLARGTAPGNGTLVSAVHTAVGILPVVAGKPEVAIYDEAMNRYGSRAALMIGDRLDTDIKGANRAGIPSVQVLTGIDQAKQVLAAVPDERPTFLLDDLRGLHEPYPATVVDGEVTTVGTAAVRLAGNRLTAERGAGIDLLRAASTAIWSSGKPIYALDVAPELYS